MKIDVNINGASQKLAATNLFDALIELGFVDATVATALNEEFVPTTRRKTCTLSNGDRLEILAPMQGG
jgi:sulfur carrier protein